MQLKNDIKNCNGCGACVVGCKDRCVKIIEDEKGFKYPTVNEDGCNRCNNCKLYCPIYNPVDMPEIDQFYEYSDDFYNRDMPAVYRQTMRGLKAGETVEFSGTLCQIAALISLMGNKVSPRLKLYPLHCDMDNPKRPECNNCIFYK